MSWPIDREVMSWPKENCLSNANAWCFKESRKPYLDLENYASGDCKKTNFIMEPKNENIRELLSLPEDIIIDILSRLSAKSISRLRYVCKLWYKLFKNTLFIKTHLHHSIQSNKFSVLLSSVKGIYYTIDFDVTSSVYRMVVKANLPRNTSVSGSQRVVSCDGLIGLSNNLRYGEAIFWNPSTREYWESSTSSYRNKYSTPKADTRYGICYDSRIDHGYKMFKIIPIPNNRDVCSEVWVRGLGSNSWNSIGNIPYNISHYSISVQPLNGIIHWIGSTKVIVSFDIVKERIKEIQIPSCYLEDKLYLVHDMEMSVSREHCYQCMEVGNIMEVGVLGKDLYLSVNAASRKGNIDLWVMKEYGVIDSWTKILSLSKDKDTCYNSLRPLHYLNNDCEILLLAVSLQPYLIGNYLVSYDPRNRKLTTLDIRGMPKYFSATTFVGSLVTLDSGDFVAASTYKDII